MQCKELYTIEYHVFVKRRILMDDSRMDFVDLGLREGIMEQNCEHDSANRMDIVQWFNQGKQFDQSVAFLQFFDRFKFLTTRK